MLENKDHYLQIFIEPKGMHLLEKEQWKEDLLLYINQHESELVFEDKIEGLQIKGLKFYTMNDSRGALNQLANLSLGQNFKGLSYSNQG